MELTILCEEENEERAVKCYITQTVCCKNPPQFTNWSSLNDLDQGFSKSETVDLPPDSVRATVPPLLLLLLVLLFLFLS